MRQSERSNRPTTSSRRRESQPARRNGAIDGLRVLAMLAIVVYHANATWLPGGFIGVTVFFTISGYLIANSLLREYGRKGTIDFKAFYQRRILRLMPLMLAVIAVTAILCAIFAPQLLNKMRPDALPALLYYENWWYIFREQSYFAASGLPSPITHFWFLAVLGQFYLIWPLISYTLSRLCRRRVTQRRIVGLLAIASAVAAALLFNPKGDPSRVYYGTDTRLAEILVGCWLAYAWPTEGDSAFSKRIKDSVPSIALDVLGLAALVGLGYMATAVNGYSPILYRGGLFGVSVLTAIIIAAVTRPDSLLAKPLGIKPFVTIAARSFGVYLWHYPLLLIMNPATRTTQLPAWGWALEALVIAAAAELSYHLVERPFQERPKDRHGETKPLQLNPIGVGAGLLVVAVSTGLLVVGPFWYKDGALQQATTNAQPSEKTEDTTEKDTSTTEPSTETTVEEIQAFTEVGEGIVTDGHKVAAAAVEGARTLERRIHGFTLDPETGQSNAPVILIGDSVPAGAIDQFYQYFPYGYINAEVGRQLYVADDVYLEEVAAGNGKDVVVFSCGDNGVADDDDMNALLEAASGHQIYLVTTRVPLPLQDMNNALFAEYAEKYDNVNLIDWYAESEGHDEYFWDDGTHLRPEGAEAYVLMLRRAIVGE